MYTKSISNRLFSIMVTVLLVLPYASCSDDSKEDGGENNTTDVAVTGNVVTIGMSVATIEGYFNLNLITETYKNPEFGIEYAENPDFSYSFYEDTRDLVGHKSTTKLTNLDPNKTYYYRSYVRLSGNNLYLGKTKSFKTNDVKNLVTSVVIEDISFNRATT